MYPSELEKFVNSPNYAENNPRRFATKSQVKKSAERKKPAKIVDADFEMPDDGPVKINKMKVKIEGEFVHFDKHSKLVRRLNKRAQKNYQKNKEIEENSQEEIFEGGAESFADRKTGLSEETAREIEKQRDSIQALLAKHGFTKAKTVTPKPRKKRNKKEELYACRKFVQATLFDLDLYSTKKKTPRRRKERDRELWRRYKRDLKRSKERAARDKELKRMRNYERAMWKEDLSSGVEYNFYRSRDKLFWRTRTERQKFMYIHEQMIVSFYDARKHKRRTYDECRFEIDASQNLFRLTSSITRGTYAPSRSITFVTYRPVPREIFAAPFRDRVVHHFIFRHCYPWWNEHFIADSYSCREGKGTLEAVRRCSRNMRRVTRNFSRPARVLKFDIKSFFMSLPRFELYKRALWGLEQQFPERGELFYLLRFLWYRIIMDNPAHRARRRGDPKNWTDGRLPKGKSMFHQKPGIGIVIGNLTSQLLSNVYLNELDQFITKKLGYKYYGRYVDDFYIFVTVEDYLKLKKQVKLISEFLKLLKLELHSKKRYDQPVEHGVGFIGAKIYPYRVIPSKRLIRNFRVAMRMVESGIRGPDTVVSYLGLLKWYDSTKVIEAGFRAVAW